MNLARKIAAVVIAGGIGLSAAACGSYSESHDHNAPAPVRDVKPMWLRIDTPGLYHTLIFGCVGSDGVYENQADNNSVMVVGNDPNCKNGQMSA